MSSSQKTKNAESDAPASTPNVERSARSSREGRLRRHFEGWKAALLLVSVAILGSALVLPRPTEPQVVPTPAYDARRSKQFDALELALAQNTAREGLSHAVRVIGERFRRLNLAQAKDPRKTADLEASLAQDVRTELDLGHAEQLLALRALQSELFVRAVRDYVAERARARRDKAPFAPSRELIELGGDFAARAEAAWFDESDRLVLTEPELRLLFRVRWGLLTRTHRVHPFGPDLNGFREYYAVLLAHPESGSDVMDRTLRQASYAQALAKIDPSYPLAFARGTLAARLGDYETAANAFQEQLRRQPDGPWAALARNHFIFARARSQQSEP